ncbi:hypothetical protein CRG98_009533 [Punica granatum]|uniref:Uncharacterized protein n=1 Tax=Punica granatum TaxID=22663 RepID=A0A2I0KP16_PUNGR|nr:hypothetical protein CRG98_009533 [Punica granatum]
MTLLIAVGSVELPGHVRPRLTYPIRVVFHIDTTRSEAVSRNEIRFRTRIARARGLWASDGLGWTRAFRVEFQARRNGSGRLGRIAFAGLGWGDSTRLNLHKPESWTELVRGRTSEKTKKGGERGFDGQERRFPPLGAAATVQEGARGGGEHYLGYAVLETGVTRLEPLNRLKFGEVERRKWRGFVRGSVADRLERKTESERARLGVDFARDPPRSRAGAAGFCAGSSWRERESDKGACRGSERRHVGRACQWWQTVAVGG